MTDFEKTVSTPSVDDETIQIKDFWIEGLFGQFDHRIRFPALKDSASRPEMLILEGQNGTGKTTIMEMISGIVSQLNFDTFRSVPFHRASLTLTNGKAVTVEKTDNDQFPLIATFDGISAELIRDRNISEYSPEQEINIERFRSKALPFLRVIDFELLTIKRTMELIRSDEDYENEYVYHSNGSRVTRKRKQNQLSQRVHSFLREAQIDHRKFFETSHLNLLPRIMSRLSGPYENISRQALLNRIDSIIESNNNLSGLGLHAENTEVATIRSFLESNESDLSDNAFQILHSYIQISEAQIERLSLVADRIRSFENIMDDFLVGKSVRVSAKSGLRIETESGPLMERDLSSGEYHFLYMMVSALLCQRRGTVLAIDEPELSLHVSWQRKLVSALTKCASGASPIFFFATHSTAISASHSYAVQSLSPIDEFYPL